MANSWGAAGGRNGGVDWASATPQLLSAAQQVLSPNLNQLAAQASGKAAAPSPRTGSTSPRAAALANKYAPPASAPTASTAATPSKLTSVPGAAAVVEALAPHYEKASAAVAPHYEKYSAALAPHYKKYKGMLHGGAKLTAAAPIVPMSVRLAAAGVGVLMDEDNKNGAAAEDYEDNVKEFSKANQYVKPQRADPRRYRSRKEGSFDVPDYVRNVGGYYPGYGVMPEDIDEDGHLTISERQQEAYDRRPDFDPDAEYDPEDRWDREDREYDPDDPRALALSVSGGYGAGLPRGFRAPGQPIPGVPVSHAFLPELLHPDPQLGPGAAPRLQPGGLGQGGPGQGGPGQPPPGGCWDKASRFGKFFSSRFCVHLCGCLSSLAAAGEATAAAQMQKASTPPRLDTRPPIPYGDVPPGLPLGSSYGPNRMLLGPDGLPVVNRFGQPMTANDPPIGFAAGPTSTAGPTRRPRGARGFLHDMLDFNLNDAPWRATFAQPSPICGLVCCVPSACCSPAVYFAFRLLETVIWGAVVMKSWQDWVTTDAPQDPGNTGHPPFWKWWTYISHQSAFLDLMYFAAVTFCTGMAAFSRRPDGMGRATPWFVKFANFLAALTPCVAVMVSIFFWAGAAAGGELVVDPLSCVLHGFNLILVFTDFAYSRIPMYFAHAWLPVFYTMGYFWFTWIYYKCGGHNYKGEPYIYGGITDWSGESESTGKFMMVEVAAMILTPLTFALVFLVLRRLGHTGRAYRVPQDFNPGAISDFQVHPRGPLRAPLAGRGYRDGAKDFFEDAKDRMEDFVELG